LIDRSWRKTLHTSQSVCPVDRQQQPRAVGWLLSTLRAGDIDRQLRAPAPRTPAIGHHHIIIIIDFFKVA